MRYLPKSDSDRYTMLADIGAHSIDTFDQSAMVSATFW